MKLTVRPGKREGVWKVLLDEKIEHHDVEVSEAGDIILTFVTDDIYTPKATRRFTLTLSREEFEMIRDMIEQATNNGPEKLRRKA